MSSIAPIVRLEGVHIPTEQEPLVGLRYSPAQHSLRPFALVLLHGLTAGKYSLDFAANYFAQHGYPCLTFDFVGHKLGHTGGELHYPHQIVANAVAALLWFQAQEPERRIVLIGHSMGGYAALAAAEQRREQVAAVATLCTGIHPSQGFNTPVGQAMLRQRADYISGAPIQVFLERFDAAPFFPLAPIPVLCIAGKQDVLVSIDQVKAMKDQLGPTAQMAVLETSHLEAPERARTILYHWLQNLETP